MLGYERSVGLLCASDDVNVIRRPDVTEDNGRIPLQPPELRPLHRRAFERGAELRL